MLKIFFLSYSFSSGTDFSRKKRALSVAADMVAIVVAAGYLFEWSDKKSCRHPAIKSSDHVGCLSAFLTRTSAYLHPQVTEPQFHCQSISCSSGCSGAPDHCSLVSVCKFILSFHILITFLTLVCILNCSSFSFLPPCFVEWPETGPPVFFAAMAPKFKDGDAVVAVSLGYINN